ncbi:lipocalin family protein [Mycobacterium sp. smrl_JER01]|uniref:lipocalin family protein n=1 Tax=Mycobacterium sp. smrl_JER01 TaxID=3402633 RepID=UPI003AC23DAD
MTSTRWALWLGTFGAGACIALGTGAGIAAAESDSPAGTAPSGEPASQTAGSDTRAHTDDTDTDTDAADEDAETADTADADADAETADTDADTDAETADTDADADDAETADITETITATETAAKAPEHTPVEDTPVEDTPVQDGPVQDSPLQSLAAPATVTGVRTGQAKLTIPVTSKGFTTRADWYFPTQADGSVSATGVIWLQHGFLGTKSFYSALAKTLSQQTNSVVVAANLPSFPSLRCGGCWINGVPTQQAVAAMFLGDRGALNVSANAAGLPGPLPEDFIMSGHSAGGGFATAVGGFYAADPGNDRDLRGVVMFDGFSFTGVVPGALQKLADPYVPVYQVAAPPQLWNLFGATTKELVAARPDRFVGATLAGGSHVDSLIGSNPLIDFFAQLVTGFSPAANTAAVYTLATGWINDMYQGLGPLDGNGIYGAPDEYIVMGDTAAVVLAPPPVVDLDRYLGTWFEVGSVKQFFSIGLVNTKAVYSLNPDGSIKVVNSGNYFVNNGPKSSIVGSALPVDPDNNKLNVRFFGPASANPPGNYWIVDLDPDYQWAIVSDPSGFSGFLLTRSAVVSAAFYQELLDRASVKGVKGRITPTRQPGAGQGHVAAEA